MAWYENPLAALLPAGCHNAGSPCSYCRVQVFGVGNPAQVADSVLANLPGHDLFYATANGEPAFMRGGSYLSLMAAVSERGVQTAVLCADPRSILPGMLFAEISHHRDHPEQSGKAIHRARELGVTPILVLIDDGRYVSASLEGVADSFGVDVVLVRGIQPEGRAKAKKTSEGLTRVWRRDASFDWYRPILCYEEIRDLPDSQRLVPTVIDSFGQVGACSVFSS